MKNLYRFVQEMILSKDETETTSFIQEEYYANLLVDNHGYSKRAAKEIAKVCKYQRDQEIEEKIEDLLESVAELLIERRGIDSSEFSDEDDSKLDEIADDIAENSSIEETLSEMVRINL